MGALTERTLTSRLRIRLLAEHHLGLRYQRVSGYGILMCFLLKFAKFFRKFVLQNVFEQLLRVYSLLKQCRTQTYFRAVESVWVPKYRVQIPNLLGQGL